jgi:hypothetical protein
LADARENGADQERGQRDCRVGDEQGKDAADQQDEAEHLGAHRR